MIKSFVMMLIPLFFVTASSLSLELDSENGDKSIEYAAEGQFEKAKKELIKSLKSNPFNKNTEFSLKIIEHAMDQKIKHETAILLFKGLALYNNGTFDEAISEFSKAVDIEPDYPISYIKRGSAYTSTGQYDLAVADASKAITLNSDYAVSFINRGIAYAKKGELDLAISDYNKAIERDLTDADAYYNRGVANSKKGRAVNAILDFDRTIEINPKFAQAYMNRGFIYMTDLQNKTMACADWKEACELGLCSNYSLAEKKGYCE